MTSRRAEIMALCALVLATAAFALTLRPYLPTLAAGPAGPTTVSAIPTSLNYQGTLRLANGSLANGTYTMVARIYAAAAGGAALYSETVSGVLVRDGIFNLVLGDAAPIPANVFADAPRYIGIQVGADPEMVPRQRLHPVPWAQQATNAVTATTLSPGATVSGLNVTGELAATGFLSSRRASDGTNAGGVALHNTTNNKEWVMTTRSGDGDKLQFYHRSGSQWFGPLLSIAPDGVVVANGELVAKARRDVGGSTPPVQITTSTYDVSLRRYVVEAPDGGSTPSSVPVDDALLMQLCGDLDGCTFSLGMRDWDPSALGQNVLATIGPFRLSLSPIVGGRRIWDLRHLNGEDRRGQDGNSSVEHIAQGWNACFLTDGKYVSGQANDLAVGLEVLNWHGAYDSANMVCVLIIDD